MRIKFSKWSKLSLCETAEILPMFIVVDLFEYKKFERIPLVNAQVLSQFDISKSQYDAHSARWSAWLSGYQRLTLCSLCFKYFTSFRTPLNLPTFSNL